MTERSVAYPQPHIPPTGYPGAQRQAPQGYPAGPQGDALLQQMRNLAAQQQMLQQQQQQQGGGMPQGGLVSANPNNTGANDPQFTPLKV